MAPSRPPSSERNHAPLPFRSRFAYGIGATAESSITMALFFFGIYSPPPGKVAPEIVAQFGILAGPLTLLPGLVSIVFYLRYGIDEARHDEIRAALAARR